MTIRVAMRVVCQQCGAEYDFEETLVSPRGTSVQCTSCGDIFVVFAEGRTTSDVAWLVQTQHGEQIRFESLRPLQSKLQDGTISRLDRFSQDGKNWRRIADITELDEFMRLHRTQKPSSTDDQYAVDEHERPTPPSSKPPPGVTSGSTSSVPARVTSVSRSPSRPSKKNTVYGLRSARSLDPVQVSEQPMRSLPVPDPNAIPRAPGIPTEASGFADEIPDHAAETNPPPPAADRPAGRVSQVARSRTQTAGGIAGIPSGPIATRTERQSSAPIQPIPSIPVRANDEQDDESDRPSAVSSSPPTRRHPVPPASTRAKSIPPRSSRQLSPHSADTHAPRLDNETATKRGLSDEAAVAMAEARENAAQGDPSSDAPTRVQPALTVPEDPNPTTSASPVKNAWLWVTLLFVGVCLAGWLLLSDKSTSDTANYKPADESVALATVDGYDKAARYITNLHDDKERPVAAQQRLSRVHALWAQALRFEAFDLRSRVTDDEQQSDLADQKSKQAKAHASDAERLATLASSRQDGDDADTLVALADAHRLARRFKEAEEALTEARRIRGELSSDFLYVRALLKANKASDIAEARTDAQRAIETDASNIAARIVLLRALLARGDTTLASAQLAELERRAPSNPRVRELAFALRDAEGERAARAADAGFPDAGLAQASQPNTATDHEDSRTFPKLEAGYQALESKQFASAEKLFSQERARLPNHPAPWVALAELALKRGRLWDAGSYLRRAEPGLASHPQARPAFDRAEQALTDARQTQGAQQTSRPDPKPETTKPKPETTKPKPETTKPKPETTKPRPETTKPKPEPEAKPSDTSTNPIHDNPYK